MTGLTVVPQWDAAAAVQNRLQPHAVAEAAKDIQRCFACFSLRLRSYFNTSDKAKQPVVVAYCDRLKNKARTC